MKEIRVHANIDIGGYTWGKYGFTARAKEYYSIVSHGNNALTKGKITQVEFDEFSSWIKKYEGVDIPMHEMAYKSYGKDLLLDSDWSGYINLTDIKQKDIFEKYLGINPK